MNAPVPKSYHAIDYRAAQFDSMPNRALTGGSAFTYKTPCRKPNASIDNLRGPTAIMYTITNIYGLFSQLASSSTKLMFPSARRIWHHWWCSFRIRCEVGVNITINCDIIEINQQLAQ
jgi:hypothetical protein